MKSDRFVWIFIFLILTGHVYFAHGQDTSPVRVSAGFLRDSIRIGDEVPFYLSASYRSNDQIIFPDSTFDFSPFEYKQKTFFTTKTRNGISRDSVVYYLTSFEVERIQRLSLPVFQIQGQDCVVHRATPDTILLQQLITKLPDSLTRDLPVRATIAYQRVPKQINVPLIIITLAILSMIAAITWVLFGKKIQRYFLIRQLQKAHREFLLQFSADVNVVAGAYSSKRTEAAVLHWKKYMESITRVPFTKLTTREALQVEKDETLGKHLRKLDAAIYGSSSDAAQPLEALKEIANTRFERKLKEVQNG